ncbi:dTDP-4-dehydrorhamnose 3,5-epimerase [Rufibacter glacialis]|uniref:dTDP-4-dehydrorhamnose 3,5-epimerase n=1 Tax=Rufibacter glacialis TaxID=1259555 RepID=A0A5M8Q4B6_9BACT|nr:dTDP-4-dehydrorhamnose 3,5-epimerase [Rufibacter glacialis]KAA6430223.1 dTDP-4-dehydrorhamnose 3,5-epimerase [Rufibacter glacialis]GGK87480.1 dTDP-4-dehydrorhamnose 3,5-epimerase [Rufibacter glacialis]
MQVTKYPIEGIVEITPRIFADERGAFLETFSAKVFAEAGITETFVQDNLSVSKKGVLRGLHFQKPPFAQAKLVSVTAGKALDVAVDLRKGSPTYGQHVTCLLDAEKRNLFFIPVGFAHGFVALEEGTVFQYKCSNYYDKASEGGLLWNDPALNINWGIETPLVSEKDEILPVLEGFESPF